MMPQSPTAAAACAQATGCHAAPHRRPSAEAAAAASPLLDALVRHSGRSL